MTREELYNHYEQVFYPRYKKGDFGGLNIPIIHAYRSWSKAKLQKAYDVNCKALAEVDSHLALSVDDQETISPDCEFENKSIYDTSAQDVIDYAKDCKNGICPVFELPVLPEDEIPFCDTPDSDDIEGFRELLDNSYLDSPNLFDLQGFVKQTVRRISNLSRDWCLRETRGFMSLFGCYTKLTPRTPRRIMRRASKFIADICKASKGMLHAQYTRSI